MVTAERFTRIRIHYWQANQVLVDVVILRKFKSFVVTLAGDRELAYAIINIVAAADDH